MFYLSPNAYFDKTGGQIPGRTDPQLHNNATNDATPDFVLQVVEPALRTAQTEIQLRQMIMSRLLEAKIKPEQRKQILKTAVDIFRRRTPRKQPRVKAKLAKAGISGIQPIGDETRPNIPKTELPTDAVAGSLVPKIRQMLAEHQHAGMPVKKLHEHVLKHGASKVLEALRKIDGLTMSADRLMLKREKTEKSDRARVATEQMFKAEKEQLPVGGQGAADDPRADPVGARKIWNKRIVEKMPDGRWHVVGHVAGLEDPKPVPQLNTALLDREHLLLLLKQLLRVHQIENGQDAHSRKKNKDKKSTS